MGSKGNTVPNTGVPVIEVARQVGNDEHIIILPTGDRAKLVPVSASLIDEVTNRIAEPAVPTWYNKEREREEQNPNDPEYIRKSEEVARMRGLAAMDAMVMFGVELLDGVPEDDGWLKKLQFLSSRGQIDLTSFDLDDSLTREYVYKRFIATNTVIIKKISALSGLSTEEVDRAEHSFRSDKVR